MDETTEPVTVDLASWLRAQITEVEQVARGAMEPDEDGRATGWWWDRPESAAERHIATWNPKRVLAECAAKRAVLALHAGIHECVGDRHGSLGTVYVAPGYIHENCPTLVALAASYADRPGYPL